MQQTQGYLRVNKKISYKKKCNYTEEDRTYCGRLHENSQEYITYEMNY